MSKEHVSQAIELLKAHQTEIEKQLNEIVDKGVLANCMTHVYDLSNLNTAIHLANTYYSSAFEENQTEPSPTNTFTIIKGGK